MLLCYRPWQAKAIGVGMIRWSAMRALMRHSFDPAVPTRDVVQQNGRTFRLKVEHTF
jgi:hypothetical protein